MTSQSLTLFVSLLIAISVSLVASESLGAACINYKFKCCPDVKYLVNSVTAQQIDQSTCQIINEQFTVGPLANSTQACKNSYTKMYCLEAIPQCCDATHPSVYKPCQSVCVQEMNDCYNLNTTIACPLGLWFKPPCNSGSGVSCP